MPMIRKHHHRINHEWEFCFYVAYDIAECINVINECGGLSIVKIDGREKCSACEAAATIVDHIEMLSRNTRCSFRATISIAEV
jgi:hypothetical protein